MRCHKMIIVAGNKEILNSAAQILFFPFFVKCWILLPCLACFIFLFVCLFV